jgi:hypothetical protein
MSGIHTPDRGYGFRARASLSSGGAERRPVGAPRNDGPWDLLCALPRLWGDPLGSRRLARSRRFIEPDQCDLPCPVVLAKIFRFPRRANHNYNCRVLSHRGALRNVINAGRDAVDAGGASDESAALRTAKSCGPDAPTLASSLARRRARRRWQTSPVTGESTKETVKPLRGECRANPV